jgi:hypothetical protein
MPLDDSQLDKLNECAKSGRYTAEDIAVLRTLIRQHTDLIKLLKDPNTSLDDVYRYISQDEGDSPADKLPRRP